MKWKEEGKRRRQTERERVTAGRDPESEHNPLSHKMAYIPTHFHSVQFHWVFRGGRRTGHFPSLSPLSLLFSARSLSSYSHILQRFSDIGTAFRFLIGTLSRPGRYIPVAEENNNKSSGISNKGLRVVIGTMAIVPERKSIDQIARVEVD